MPWTRAHVLAFMGDLSDTALRRVEAAFRPVPRVPLPGRGVEPIDRYDEDEVRQWWRDCMAAVRAGRVVGVSAKPKARTPRRGAVRLPFALGERVADTAKEAA